LLNSDKNAQGLPSLLLHKQLPQSKSATQQKVIVATRLSTKN